jgi:hypothetical protein
MGLVASSPLVSAKKKTGGAFAATGLEGFEGQAPEASLSLRDRAERGELARIWLS